MNLHIFLNPSSVADLVPVPQPQDLSPPPEAFPPPALSPIVDSGYGGGYTSGRFGGGGGMEEEVAALVIDNG